MCQTSNMTAEEKRLYTRYFYNSVIEFIYFIILYLETYGTASVSVLSKYVKFFKIEVSNLISSFEGKPFEAKLHQMLKNLDCFVIFGNEVKISENINLKDVIFEDLVLSKCVDLLLKGLNNVDDICKNLNFSSVIIISKQNLLHIIEKYSFISVNENQTVTLHHVHGLLGFEDYLCNSVIGYFHDILYHGKILSFKEIRNHSKSLSFCGISNMIGIFSVLHCSTEFDCENGYILLKKKCKKYPKKKPLHMEVMEANFSSRSLPIEQIVYSVYGSFLHQWSGEVGTVTESMGVIYCVVDFTNGYQGVFNICFSKASLKVISEMDNLTKYLSVRDVVEFDAEYYSGKKLDRCWKATRVKLLSRNKFQYDELLSAKLSDDSKLQRNKCGNNMCCSKINPTMNGIVNNSLNSKDHEKQLFRRKIAATDYELCSLNNLVNELETVSVSDPNKYTSYNQEISNDLFAYISNTLIVDYLFMFGHIYVLMGDKGIAIAKHEGKFYNILFMKDSVFPPNTSEHFFLKGQKVLALIPYLGKLESFCVATLMYGLNEEETSETEYTHIPPKEFAVKTFLLNALKNFCSQCCNDCSFLKGLQIIKLENLDIYLKYKIQIAELYDFITKQYKVYFMNDQLLHLLHSVCKENINGEKFSTKFFYFIIKLSKCLTKHAIQEKLKIKNKRKLKRVDINDKSDSLINVQLQELCKALWKSTATGEGKSTSDPNLTIKSNLLDVHDSLSSLNSYKTCSTDSSDIYYSCESKCNTPEYLSNSSLNDNSLTVTTSSENLPCETGTVTKFKLIPLPTILNDKCNVLSINSSQEFELSTQQNLKNDSKSSKCHKYLSLQSVPSLKCSVKKKKGVVFPYTLKPPCKNCVKNSLKITASISLISNSFFFFTTNIDGHNIVLPLPKQDIPSDLQGKIKLNSCGEITIIPSVLVNSSHIMSARMVI